VQADRQKLLSVFAVSVVGSDRSFDMPTKARAVVAATQQGPVLAP
jgi:hypothetical protein